MVYKKIPISNIFPKTSTSANNASLVLEMIINSYDEVYMYYNNILHKLYLVSSVGPNIMVNCDILTGFTMKAKLLIYDVVDIIKKGAVIVVKV